jgi:primosomal protein N' (replication factor Y)
VLAARHDTEGFLQQERELRRSPPYPPETTLVNVVVSGTEEKSAGQGAAEVADWYLALVSRHALPIEVLGPAPCPLSKIKDRWRWHVLLKGPSKALGQVVRYGARRLGRRRGLRVIVDRDPVSLL